LTFGSNLGSFAVIQIFSWRRGTDAGSPLEEVLILARFIFCRTTLDQSQSGRREERDGIVDTLEVDRAVPEIGPKGCDGRLRDHDLLHVVWAVAELDLPSALEIKVVPQIRANDQRYSSFAKWM
jgi:hypothetical protein